LGFPNIEQIQQHSNTMNMSMKPQTGSQGSSDKSRVSKICDAIDTSQQFLTSASVREREKDGMNVAAF
jgi:hypothetical protein